MNKFQIIEKSDDNSKYYYLKKTILGISLFQWSFIEFSQTILAPFLIVVNIMCYNLSIFYILPVHIISLIISYHIGRKKYNSIHDAENVIKNYVKLESAKRNKVLSTPKNTNILNYNIDIEKGIFEKEFQSNVKK